MSRRPDRLTVTAVEAVGHLRKARPDVGPREMLDEIRINYCPRSEIRARDSDGRHAVSCTEIPVWKKLQGEIALLKAMGFTFCQLTEAVTALSAELRGWRDRKGVAAPDLPPCTCRYCT